MAAQPSETSESVRQQGNEQYKAGNFAAAVPLYRRAAELDPKQATPLSNLSIALFELADYDGCDAACGSALALLKDDAHDASAKQKIYERQVRARLAAMKTEEAEVAANLLVGGTRRTTLLRCLANYRTSQNEIKNVKDLQTRLILELPRYKPMIRTIPEYYPMGHDTPEPLHSSELLKTNRKKIALMFGGIGDARNLHCTLLSIMGDEVHSGKKGKLFTQASGSGKLFHFTLVDIKPAAIARDLVMFLLLSDIADYEGDMVGVVKDKLLPCLYYTYLAPVMPRGVYDVLQKRIKTLIEMLNGERDLPAFLDVSKLYRPEIIRVLRQWQAEAGNEYPASRMREQAVLGRREAQMGQLMQGMQYGMTAPYPAPKGCVKEKKFYEATGLLPLAHNNYKLYRPELRACIEGYGAGGGPNSTSDIVARAVAIGNDTWAPNVTLVDLDWQRNMPHETFDIDVGNDPYDFADRITALGLVPEPARGLYDYVQRWFMVVSSALGELKHRMKIEACVGDITAVLEQIRYGVVGHREGFAMNDGLNGAKQSPEVAADALSTLNDTNEYPRVYDRIHLSNIPDYIGGTLSSFLYALPLTHFESSSYITSTNLRNPPRFKTMASFDNEYITLSTAPDLAKVFQVSMEPLEGPGEPLPTCRYNIWRHHRTSKQLQNLMPRDKLEIWLKRLFLKIAIPKDKQQIESWELIYSPINLTVFFRLLTHLHGAGYPTHWLAGVWTEILSGSITTSARPPRSEPLSIKEVKTTMPLLSQSTAPFVAELSTLTALWQPTLPFVITDPNLPLLQDVHRYSVRFASVSDSAANIPTFVLVFYDRKMPAVGPLSSLRQHLLDDEVGLPQRVPSARKINDGGLHIVTTFKYDRSNKTATFWFREDVMEQLKSLPASKQLQVAIWRTDDYTRQSSPQKFDRIHDHGVWIRGQDDQMPDSSTDEEEDVREDDSSDDERPRGRYPPSANPQVNMMTEYMESVMQAMPNDSREQRLRLAQQLMEQGMREMGK